MYSILLFIPAFYFLFRPVGDCCYFLFCRNRLEPVGHFATAAVSFRITQLAKKYNPYLPSRRIGFLSLSKNSVYTAIGILLLIVSFAAIVIFLPDFIQEGVILSSFILSWRILVQFMFAAYSPFHIRDNKLLLFYVLCLPLIIITCLIALIYHYIN